MSGTGLPDDQGNGSGELARESSGDRAARRIRQLIFDRVLEPGSRIRQDEIADALGISRIPLREALIALEREGWVVLELHRGAFVTTLDEASMADHYDMLGAVYAFAATAALRRTPDRRALVADLRSLQEQLAAEPAPGAAGRVLRHFHLRVIAAARSTRTQAVLRAIPSLIPGDIFTILPRVVDIEREAVPRIVDACAAGDGDAVAEAYRTMMRSAGREVAALFRKRNLFFVEPEVEPVS